MNFAKETMDARPKEWKSTYLSASAGSGKTRALVKRYLDLIIESGIQIDQAVAITFTDKAAAEMKQRVMRSLAEAVRRSMDADALFKKIIRGRQELRISTIHSFCMSILKRHPLEAGLPPDFSVQDSRDKSSTLERAVLDALDAVRGRDDILGPLSKYSSDEIESRLKFLMSLRGRLRRLEIDAAGPDGLLRALYQGMRIEETEKEINGLLSSRDWKDAFLRMESLLKMDAGQYEKSKGRLHISMAEAAAFDIAARISDELHPIYFTAGDEPRKSCFIPKKVFRGDVSAYEETFKEVSGLLSRFDSMAALIRAWQEEEAFLKLYLEAESRYNMFKLREGIVDFDDLEIYAYTLLSRPESLDILYRLDRRILHFLVDEFQDTNDIQWAILEKLTEEIFAGMGADKPMRPTLFVVGDEKQSIYRFREANYQLLGAVRKKMELTLPEDFREIKTLTTNYRSAPEIVETVNQVFDKLWGGDYKPSDAFRKGHGGSVRLIEVGPEYEAEPGLEPEAEVLASEIKTAVEQGIAVYKESGGQWRRQSAGYGDCAVLIQTRTRLKDYEAGLRRFGIPYRVIGGIGFYEEDEIQAIMNVLFFLWNPRDRFALAACLKSALFGLTDTDIMEIMTEAGDIFAALKKKDQQLGGLMERLSREAGLLPLSKLIHRIVNDTGAYVRFGAVRGAQAIFNIDKLLDTARGFDRRGFTTLQDFVEWVKYSRQSEEREATADVTLPEYEGSVVITTVHKAKGLEFPVVFLPGMNQSMTSLSRGPEALIEASVDRIVMAVKGKGHSLYERLWEHERKELMLEHQRLLYVAMTRPRDHLIMIGRLKNSKTKISRNTWLSYIHEANPLLLFQKKTEPRPGIYVYAWPEQPVKAQGTSPRYEGPRYIDIDAGIVACNIAPVPAAATLEWRRATDYIKPVEKNRQAVEAHTPPLLRGSILHRCLEEYTKTGSYDLGRILTTLPEASALGADTLAAFQRDAAGAIERLLKNDEFSWFLAPAPDAFSELPFLYNRDDAIVSGVIDRVVIRDCIGFVIDYKAIFLNNEDEAEKWKDHYRPQLKIYCEAVKNIFGLDRAEGYILFIDSSRLVHVASV